MRREGSSPRLEHLWRSCGAPAVFGTETYPGQEDPCSQHGYSPASSCLYHSKVFGDSIEFVYCAVPPSLSTLKQSDWWIHKRDLRFVLTELLKLLGYRLILLLPRSAVQMCMRIYAKLF
jgi:hypothetical protein